jgi:hypothetical protein
LVKPAHAEVSRERANVLRMNAHLEAYARLCEQRGEVEKAERFRRATVPEFMIPEW